MCMDISLLYFDDCPNWKVADERLSAIAAERADLAVTRHLVDTLEDAERVGFHGSPSILVDGVDVFAGPDAAVGFVVSGLPHTGRSGWRAHDGAAPSSAHRRSRDGE